MNGTAGQDAVGIPMKQLIQSILCMVWAVSMAAVKTDMAMLRCWTRRPSDLGGRPNLLWSSGPGAGHDRQ
jgi:hypothetical protein